MVGNDKWLTNDTETPFSDQQEQACLVRNSQSGVSAELAEDSVTSGKESKAHSGDFKTAC